MLKSRVILSFGAEENAKVRSSFLFSQGVCVMRRAIYHMLLLFVLILNLLSSTLALSSDGEFHPQFFNFLFNVRNRKDLI